MSGNYFAVGSQTRYPYRRELVGKVDEVRISDVVRGADEFIFGPAIPEPMTMSLLALGGLGVLARRRRR